MDALYKEIIKHPFEKRIAMYPAEPYFMHSADNALINVMELAKAFNVSTVLPTNENISSGLFGRLFGGR